MPTITSIAQNHCFNTPAITLPGVAVQLYSLRKELERDFFTTLETLASIGITHIETYPFPESVTLEHAAEVLHSLGMSVIGMHVDFPMGKTSIEDVLRMSDAFQCPTVVYSGWPEAGKYDHEALQHTLEHFDAASQLLESYGLEFVLHNHWYEFEPHGVIVPFYHLLHELTSKVFFEIDVYWAKTAGQDPATVVKMFGERIILLHVKDGAATKEALYNQTSVGKGSIDFHAIFKAIPPTLRYAIIEFDEYNGSIFDGIRESYQYLREQNFIQRMSK